MLRAGRWLRKAALAIWVWGLTTGVVAAQDFEASSRTMHTPPAPHFATQPVRLFGHVTLLQAYDLPHFQGTWALVELSDYPDTTVALLSDSHNVQTLLETALATGNLMYFVGRQFTHPPLPKGGSTVFDVFAPDEVNVFSNHAPSN